MHKADTYIRNHCVSGLFLSFHPQQQLNLRDLDPSHQHVVQVIALHVPCTCSTHTILIIDGHNRRWIDGSIPISSIDTIDRYYWSCWPPIVSIHRLKIFSLIHSIDHRSQNPDQNDDHRFIGSYSTDGIDPSIKNRFPCPFFYMKESQEIFFNNRPR
jgi:hypothetical protein